MPDWKSEVRERLAHLRLAPTHETAIVEEHAQDVAGLAISLLVTRWW